MYCANVLLIGDDAEELGCRAAMLCAAGHQVVTAIGRYRGILVCSAQFFEVVLISLADQEEARNLQRDLGIVSPASEIVDVNHWRAAGLEPEYEPGFLLSLLTAAVQPMPDQHQANASGRHRGPK